MDLGLENIVSHEKVNVGQLLNEIKELDREYQVNRLREQALENVDILRDSLNKMKAEDRGAVIRYIAMSNEVLSDLDENNYDKKLKDILVSNEYTLIELLIVIALISMIAGIFGGFIARALRYRGVLKDFLNQNIVGTWNDSGKEWSIPTAKRMSTCFKGCKAYINDIDKLCKNIEKTSIDQIFGYAKGMGLTIKEKQDTSFKADGSIISDVKKQTVTAAGYTGAVATDLAKECCALIDLCEAKYKQFKSNKDVVKVDKQKAKAIKFMTRVVGEELMFAASHLQDIIKRSSGVKY